MSTLHKLVSFGQEQERLARLVAGGEPMYLAAWLVVGAILLAGALVLVIAWK